MSISRISFDYTSINQPANYYRRNTYSSENSPEKEITSQKFSSKSESSKETKGVKQEKNLEDPEVQKKIQKLKDRDREVKIHEQAHLSAAGQYAVGGASYEYEVGPDGVRYAVGGEVSLDISKIPNDPEATIRKAEIIRKAALAPAEPSGQDRNIAARSTQIALEAEQELAKQKTDPKQSYTKDGLKAPLIKMNPMLIDISL